MCPKRFPTSEKEEKCKFFQNFTLKSEANHEKPSPLKLCKPLFFDELRMASLRSFGVQKPFKFKTPRVNHPGYFGTRIMTSCTVPAQLNTSSHAQHVRSYSKKFKLQNYPVFNPGHDIMSSPGRLHSTCTLDVATAFMCYLGL